ncbi:MAG: hypothetical protein RIQ81_246 [Pseudomonadota bacterium]|jgi:voltage-gated potassium channel
MGFFKKVNDIATPWELTLLGLLAWTVIDMPLEAAFPHAPSRLEIGMDLLISVAIAFDGWRHGLRTGYIKNLWLARGLAAVATAPLLGISAYLAGGTEGWHIYLQIFRLAIVPGLIGAMTVRSRTNIVPKRLKFAAATAIVMLAFNALACIWLVIYPSTEDPVTAYNKAMYWLVTTIATVGYGDITPSTNFGRIYTMGIMILGAAAYGVLIASASRLMLASDRRKEQKKEKLEAMQSFFANYDVPKNLQSEVIGFFHHVWSRKVSDDERSILSDLPQALQSELQTYMNIKPISRVSLFKGVSFQCLVEAAKRLEQTLVPPGERIIRKGENGTDMFLIGHGAVNVHIGDQFITSLGSGACVGEMALIGDGIRSTDVTTTSYCEVFKLSREKFDQLTRDHADLRENIARIAEERKSRLAEQSATDADLNKAS